VVCYGMITVVYDYEYVVWYGIVVNTV